MYSFKKITHLVLAAFSILTSSIATAQNDLSGHWEGQANLFSGLVEISFDIVKNSDDSYAGTISQPQEGIRHLPLLAAKAENNSVQLVAREDQPFNGTLTADGQRIDGALDAAGYEVPLSLTRSGDAQIQTADPIPAVANEFTGTWKGNIADTQVEMNITNNSDGTATAAIINLSQGRLTIPAASINVDGTQITLDLVAISGSYSGNVNDDASAIEGTFTQGSAQMPLNFSK
ncbi:MAG: hypothetical protein O2971_19585 [Proteobacteria bacterium]|nr:hypothetical protein [Pseudomonadota bacterium]